MGFFSTNCRACGHPLLSPMATNEVNRWMSEGIVIYPNGNVHCGEYDGYGGLGGFRDEGLENGSVYHKDCHSALGFPLEFAGKSDISHDQGWFFDDGDHDMKSPLKDEVAKAYLAPVGQKKIAAIERKRLKEAKRSQEFRNKEMEILTDNCPHCGFGTAFVVEKGSQLKIRCPNQDCRQLWDISDEVQAKLRELFAEYPDQKGIWDDEEVSK